MTDKTVKELAISVGSTVEKLLEQIMEAGLPQSRSEDIITTKDQDNLINYLKSKNRVNNKNSKISLKKRTMNTATLSSSNGVPKTINVEIRKKEIFNKTNSDILSEKNILSKYFYENLRIRLLETIKDLLIKNNCEIQEEDLKSRIEFDEESKIKKLNFSNLKLESLNQFGILDLKETVELDLSKNNITKIIISSRMPKMLKLNLTGNPIEEIIINSDLPDWNCLEGLETRCIKLLDLSSNNFTEFKIDKEFSNLEKLILKSNKGDIEEVLILSEFLKIKELNFSHSNIKRFSVIKKLPESLLVLNISNNNINYLKLPHEIFNKKENGSYTNISLEKNPFPDLILSALKKPTQEEMYKELRDIFFDVITVNRVKLIFLGNTGIGKTTLYKVLKKDMPDYIEKNGDSTEGINIFNYNFCAPDKKKIEVMGYDFGGQDYYHNTHYSHFSSNALYILLWGNGQYLYHRSYFDRFNSNGESKREVTYPLNYWLGSVSYFKRKDDVLSNLDINNKSGNNLKLHLIQNPKENINFELDRVSLKKKYNFINGFHDFYSLTEKDFSSYQNELKEKINNIIDKYSTQQTYPKILAEVEKAIKERVRITNEIIISVEDIREIFIKVKKRVFWEGSFEQIMEWLDVTMSLYWISQKKLEKYTLSNIIEIKKLDRTKVIRNLILNFNKRENYLNYEKNFLISKDYDFLSDNEKNILTQYAVIDLSQVNEIIHNFLISTMYHEDAEGYYNKEVLFSVWGSDQDHIFLEYISAFMLYNKIWFEAPDKEDDEKVFIAPNYLKENLSLAEEIFLDSFDCPIIEYRFDDFYHVNIFTEVLLRFKRNLISNKSLKSIDYLLWKNKAILFEILENENINHYDSESIKIKKQPLLYLEFDLGEILSIDSERAIDDNEEVRKPAIRISTYNKNKFSASHSFIREIIRFLDNQLAGYNYKKFALAPNQIDYIDVNNINNNLLSYNGKSTGLFSYNNRIYRSADFSLFTKEKLAMRKIFISHSTEDYQEVQDFITHLSPLKREGLIDHWHCSQLVAGDTWDSAIQEKLWESDIICMLISPNWLANEYIFHKELKVAIERKEKFTRFSEGKDIVIFPIIIKPCLWGRVNSLSSFQAAPQKAMEVSEYADKNKAWNDVLRKLIDVLNRMDNPEYTPEIGGKLGKLYIDQYQGKLTGHN
ncbi:translation initiation factor IF-2 associated domain-containing protein [Acinetobacter pittii]|uniref:translation initiation factor IF-2 associated domain-containing protein n=1 Tax=Acinetobacter pittii TaxID=48296 RepID=UPI00192ACDEA|nr:translation initiation factor IF-2 associated domain-containing protein [Acinetobacter pittii]